MTVLSYPDSTSEVDLGVLHHIVAAIARVADCEYAVGHFVTNGVISAATTVGDRRLAAYVDIDRLLVENFSNIGDPRLIYSEEGLRSILGSNATNGRFSLAFLALFPFGNDRGNVQGMLCLGSAYARPKLSAAQQYTIRWMLKGSLPIHALEQRPVSNIPAPKGFANKPWRLLESVVVNARDSILITESEPIDSTGPRIVYCNPAFTSITGYTEAEVIGKTPRILQGPGTSRAALDAVRAALQSWTPIETELLNYRKDGSEFWMELSIFPVADEGGRFTHWVSIQRDATARKSLEALAVRERAAAEEANHLYLSLAERQRTHDALLHAATHDELTGLRNRSYLVKCLNEALVQSDFLSERRVAVIYLDLDGFKAVNDSLGHAAGDTLLREVSERLKTCIRSTDVLARISGDEFVMLIRGVGFGGFLEELAGRIHARLEARLPIGFSNFTLSGSLGAVLLTQDHKDAEDVLRDADAAMYAAKRSGKGQFVVFQNEMREHIMNTMALQSELRAAKNNNEFAVHYQPIFDIRTRAIVGVEALLRWTHPIRGAVAPSDFIPIAEKIDIIGDIDHWVRDTSFAQFLNWRREYPGIALKLNINVSAIELRNINFIPNLEALAARYHFPLRDLEIEITERVLLDDSPKTMMILKALRERGVRVALDDFGTGYSSLAYIANYEIDALKIDKSFVSKMLHDAKTMSVLESIIFLARRLKLDIVAEGVETEEQLVFLSKIGCDFVQGHHLGRPLDGAASTDRLRHYLINSLA